MSSAYSPAMVSAFIKEEYRHRLEGARALMAEQGLDALLITTEANFRWFTGLRSQGWVSPTRPMFLVVPAARDPIAIIPAGNRVTMQATAWLDDVRTWPSPHPADEGVSLLIEALSKVSARHGRIGGEFGPEHQLRMPILDFWRVQRALAPLEFVDGSAITRRLRMIKSTAEIGRIHASADLVSAAFEALPERLGTAASEREAALELHLDILRRGAEKVPYLVAASGPGGYATINSSPSERALGAGDLLIIDVCSTVDGYFSDFDRNFGFGRVDDEALRAHDLVYRATEAGLAAARPGARAAELWQAMADALGRDAVQGANVGRMGHGIGLNMTEPPSIHPEDETVLEPGMAISIEPGIGYTSRNGERKVMVHEENVVITDQGARLLTRRAPAEMPVIG